MHARVKEKWMPALRSGDYEQGRGWLNVNNKYCCLGVLCDLYLKEHNGQWVDDEGLKSIDGLTCTIPPKVREWSGLPHDLGADVRIGEMKHSLSGCNDGLKLNFNQIADLIEEQL